tara:strand:+ start:3626 stop:4198 length:573 start_codon:yes stop_codon:yes gene_type:complete
MNLELSLTVIAMLGALLAIFKIQNKFAMLIWMLLLAGSSIFYGLSMNSDRITSEQANTLQTYYQALNTEETSRVDEAVPRPINEVMKMSPSEFISSFEIVVNHFITTTLDGIRRDSALKTLKLEQRIALAEHDRLKQKASLETNMARLELSLYIAGLDPNNVKDKSPEEITNYTNTRLSELYSRKAPPQE